MVDGSQQQGNKARSSRWSLPLVLVVSVIAGIVLWGGLNTAMEYTSRTEFCVSCHEMTLPYEELKRTVHFKSRSGATAQCADCHIATSKTPADYLYKVYQKIYAVRDVVGHLQGKLDTPEKYEAQRFEMAKRVWERMKARDSRECKNCHNFSNMDTEKQKDRSVVKHEGAIEDGKTCIDCHKGIAHKPVHHLLDAEPQPKPAG